MCTCKNDVYWRKKFGNARSVLALRDIWRSPLARQLNASWVELLQIWSPDGANCISCKFGLQMTSVVLVPNLVTIWHHLHLLQSWLTGNLNQFESLSLSNRRGMPCCICVNDVKVETESLNAEKEYCSGGCFPFKLAIAIAPLTYSTVRSSWVFAAVEEFFHWIPLA